MDQPQLSVIVLTYDHERFIEAALRSVLEQKAAPHYEVLVAEDFSRDRTRSILDRLGHEFPRRFEILRRERNLGLSRNLEDAWSKSRGKYIAILEGDDYWCDDYKLSKVYSAMEEHPHWVGCFHSVRQVSDEWMPRKRVLPESIPSSEIDFQNLVQRNWIPTYSAVAYRRGIVGQFPAWHRELMCGDWALHILHAEHGNFGFISDVMTEYRVHSGGMWSGTSDIQRWRQAIRLFELLHDHYPAEFEPLMDAGKAAVYQECDLILRDLRRIERRYHQLQLHRIAAIAAAIVKPIRRIGKSLQPLFTFPNRPKSR